MSMLLLTTRSSLSSSSTSLKTPDLSDTLFLSSKMLILKTQDIPLIHENLNERKMEKTKKLSKERKFHHVNSGVPITYSTIWWRYVEEPVKY